MCVCVCTRFANVMVACSFALELEVEMPPSFDSSLSLAALFMPFWHYCLATHPQAPLPRCLCHGVCVCVLWGLFCPFALLLPEPTSSQILLSCLHPLLAVAPCLCTTAPHAHTHPALPSVYVASSLTFPSAFTRAQTLSSLKQPKHATSNHGWWTTTSRAPR